MSRMTALAALLALASATLLAQDRPPFDNPWLDKNLSKVDLAKPLPLLTKEGGLILQGPFRPAPPSVDRLDLVAGSPGKPGWDEGASGWVPCLFRPIRITAISHGNFFVGQEDGNIRMMDSGWVWNWWAATGTPAPIVAFPNTDIAQGAYREVIRTDRWGAWIWSGVKTRGDISGLALDGHDRLWIADGLDLQFTSGAQGGTPTVIIPAGSREPFQGGTFKPTMVAADPRFDQVVVASEDALYRVDRTSRTLQHLSGIPGGGPAVDGAADKAQFGKITGLAVHESGWMLVSDAGAGAMRFVSPTGDVTTLTRYSGNGVVFRIVTPGEVVFYGDAALVVDTDQHVVWKIH